MKGLNKTTNAKIALESTQKLFLERKCNELKARILMAKTNQFATEKT